MQRTINFIVVMFLAALVAEQPRVAVLCLWDDATRYQTGDAPRVPMPNYDALRAVGTTYDQVVSLSTVCRPALVPYEALREPWRCGIRNLDSPALCPLTDTLFSRAHALGYVVGGGGKFWEPQPAIHNPYLYGADYWFDAGCPEHDPPMQFGRQTVQPLADWVLGQLQAGRKVVVLPWWMLPHQPLDPTPEQLARVPAACVGARPTWIPPEQEAAWRLQVRRSLANHLRADDAMGELMRLLPKDTVWLVCNDNGITQGEVTPQFSKQSPYPEGYLVRAVISPSDRPGSTDYRLTSSLDVARAFVDVLAGKPFDPKARTHVAFPTFARGGHNWEVDRPMAITVVSLDGRVYIKQLATWNSWDEQSGDVTWKHLFTPLPGDPVRTAATEETYRDGDCIQDTGEDWPDLRAIAERLEARL